MSEKKQHICIIDDNVDHQELISNVLTQEFIITRYESNQTLKDAINHGYLPELVFVSLELPESDGFNACETIKLNPSTSHVPIIAISKINDLKIKLKSYVLGADELIQLPIESGELFSIIDRWRKHGLQLLQLGHKANQANTTALEALTQNSELGAIVSFLNQSSEIVDYETLAKKLLEVTKQLGMT